MTEKGVLDAELLGGTQEVGKGASDDAGSFRGRGEAPQGGSAHVGDEALEQTANDRPETYQHSGHCVRKTSVETSLFLSARSGPLRWPRSYFLGAEAAG